MLDTLETLCALRGVSGREDEVRSYILERVMPHADEIRTDAMGNLMVFKRGAKAPEKRVMLTAHMDEVGLIITSITEDGYLKFGACGGIDRRVLPGKSVFVGENRVLGVIGLKPVHLTDADERKKLPKLTELYIDIGAKDKKTAEALVELGDVCAFEDNIVRFGDGFIKAKALDDRCGCACMVELLESELPCDCWFAFTVQEEAGARGASVAAYELKPDAALILETTTAADLAGVEGADRVCCLGKGVVIPFMDRTTIYDKALFKTLTRLADENGIPWQTKSRVAGGTDASAFQRTGCGAAVAAISVPVRNIHSPGSIAKQSECADQLRLARAFLEETARG